MYPKNHPITLIEHFKISIKSIIFILEKKSYQ
jgi:hypothetical protein